MTSCALRTRGCTTGSVPACGTQRTHAGARFAAVTTCLTGQALRVVTERRVLAPGAQAATERDREESRETAARAARTSGSDEHTPSGAGQTIHIAGIRRTAVFAGCTACACRTAKLGLVACTAARRAPCACRAHAAWGTCETNAAQCTRPTTRSRARCARRPRCCYNGQQSGSEYAAHAAHAPSFFRD